MEFDLSLVGFFHKVQERSKAHDDKHEKLRLKEKEEAAKRRDQLIFEYITNMDYWYYYSKTDEYTLSITVPMFFTIPHSEWIELFKKHFNVEIEKLDFLTQLNVMIFKFKD